MSEHLIIPRQLRGRIWVENEDGFRVEATNLVVYTGGDIIAQLLAGNGQYRISHMYFGFENDPAPTFAPPDRGDTVEFFSTLVSPQDYLRAAIMQPTQIEAADPNHEGNRVIFNAVASGTVGVNGLDFGAAFASHVGTLGLGAAPTGAVAGDVLYARVNLPTPLPAAGSGQVSATWATEAD